MVFISYTMHLIFPLACFLFLIENSCADDILGCGGFVKSHVSLDFSKIEIGLYTKEGSLKEKTECAPTNGYYFLPLYEKGEYVLKVHPPAGWSFEPAQVDLNVDGVSDQCSTGQDVNFVFNGFGITGRVVTAGQKTGPSGISVQLINEKGETRNTVTSTGGDFHFTPVIPGKYTVKASHPRWKLEPSQAAVQVKEGNTALPSGVLAVKGFDVKGSVTSFGAAISGIYVLLYSKDDKQAYRVEGCNTALLQGIPDSPICHSITDTNGEFSFGLVPAGQYKLIVLSTPPGQVTVTYNVKPDSVPFTVQHDSLYIKNAFEVSGFTVVGSLLTAVGGAGLGGARVELDGRGVGKTDTSGKFTLPNLQPATYSISFQHEYCQVEPITLVVTSSGPQRAPRAAPARWRVCGAVTPAGRRDVLLQSDQGSARAALSADSESKGKWCTFLPPGVYSAKVELTEQEQRDGLQFFPVSQKVSVGNGPVDGVSFSLLKGRVSGTIRCLRPADCASERVTLKPRPPAVGHTPQPLTTNAENGAYSFSDVPGGSVELSVSTARLCWEQSQHVVLVAREQVSAPAFVHTGYLLRFRASHPIEVEYSGEGVRGVVSVAAGAGAACVPRAGAYALEPRGCHKFSPPVLRAHTSDSDDKPPPTLYFIAVAHSVTLKVLSPVAVADLVLKVSGDARGTSEVGPLQARPDPDGGFVYEHTMYMADGEVALVSAKSATLLFSPSQPQQVWGTSNCQAAGLVLRALRGLTRKGRVTPPVAGAAVTLTGEGVKLTQVTTEDGTYSFGPLDASKDYTITAEKESYVFSAPDENGDIVARKLAEITVELVDDADGTPLQGALVSVSGGTYRRNALASALGRLTFPALQPDQYYVKPHMKEYRFSPPSTIVALPAGETRHLTLRGVRVAWSCSGRLAALAGAGWARAGLLAAPAPGSAPPCAPEEATTEPSGAFRYVAGACAGRLAALAGAGWARAGLLAAPAPGSAPPCAPEEATTEPSGAFRYVAGACAGRLAALAGAGWARAGLLAAPAPGSAPPCAPEEATTEPSGAFRYVAGACAGRLAALAGAGWARAGLLAAPAPGSAPPCAPEEATTEPSGAFRYVAGACAGRLAALAGAGWARAGLLAAPAPGSAPPCAPEEATTEPSGAFRYVAGACAGRLAALAGAGWARAGLLAAPAPGSAPPCAPEEATTEPSGAFRYVAGACAGRLAALAGAGWARAGLLAAPAPGSAPPCAPEEATTEPSGAFRYVAGACAGRLAALAGAGWARAGLLAAPAPGSAPPCAPEEATTEPSGAFRYVAGACAGRLAALAGAGWARAGLLAAPAPGSAPPCAPEEATTEPSGAFRYVAGACAGRLAALAGAGWARAGLLAAPAPGSAPPCAPEEATTEPSGAFRIRGLLPNCVYTIQLKESTSPDLVGLKLVKAPATLEVKNNKDITDVRLIAIQPAQLTDASVVVYTPLLEHYRTLRLTLALEATPHTPIYSAKLDPAGYSATSNPGLLHPLPRLPADGQQYVLQLSSSLSRATHELELPAVTFTADGSFQQAELRFLPKVKSSEVELRATSLLVVPLLGLLAFAYSRRAPLLAGAAAWARAAPRAPRAPRAPARRDDALDKTGTEPLLGAPTAAAKKTKKKL